MSKARLAITAVAAEGRTQGDVAQAYGASQGWVSSQLLLRANALPDPGVLCLRAWAHFVEPIEKNLHRLGLHNHGVYWTYHNALALSKEA